MIVSFKKERKINKEVGIYKNRILRKKKENTLSTEKKSKIQENNNVQEKKKENTLYNKTLRFKKKRQRSRKKKEVNGKRQKEFSLLFYIYSIWSN